jgi:hypothetical protein
MWATGSNDLAMAATVTPTEHRTERQKQLDTREYVLGLVGDRYRDSTNERTLETE